MNKKSGHIGLVRDKDGNFVGIHGPDEECPADSHEAKTDTDTAGPSMWNSAAFRDGWDAAFGKSSNPN